MKLGKPTTLVPVSSGKRDYGKYAKIYNAVDKLPANEWLPVIFDTVKCAYNFRVAVETHRTRVMEAKQRKLVVYVRNKPPTNGTWRTGKK